MPTRVSYHSRRAPYRRLVATLCLVVALGPRGMSAQAGITPRDVERSLALPRTSVLLAAEGGIIRVQPNATGLLRPVVQDTVNKKDHTALGALLGIVGGAVIGYDIAVHNRRSCSGQQCDTGFGFQAVIYPVVGGFTGGLIGALIGGFVSRN